MSEQQSAHHSEAFRLYKANSPFNGQLCFTDYLNQSLALGQPLSASWSSKADELDLLILRSPLKENTTLYRATLDGYVNGFIGNGELIYPAFMSTSADETAVQRHFSNPFRNILGAFLSIECPAGTPALDMEADPSFGGHEREFLLTRGSRFEVLGVTETFDKYAMAQTVLGYYAANYSSLKYYKLRYKLSGHV